MKIVAILGLLGLFTVAVFVPFRGYWECPTQHRPPPRHEPCHNVPDGGSTAFLLLGTVGGLTILRKKLQ